jgi:hypothetical protein
VGQLAHGHAPLEGSSAAVQMYRIKRRTAIRFLLFSNRAETCILGRPARAGQPDNASSHFERMEQSQTCRFPGRRNHTLIHADFLRIKSLPFYILKSLHFEM